MYVAFFLKHPLLVFVEAVKLLFYWAVNNVYGKNRSEIGRGCNVHPTVLFREPENIVLGDRVLINHGCVIQGGKESAKVVIGSDSQFGPYVQIHASNHFIGERDELLKSDRYTEADIIIGDNVWIGAGSIILSGVQVGEGAIVAAGSVVASDVPEYAIWGGEKSRLLKQR